MFKQSNYHTKQSSKTRFVNFVYEGDECIGHINGALTHQIGFANSLENLLARAEELKDTSEISFQKYEEVK